MRVTIPTTVVSIARHARGFRPITLPALGRYKTALPKRAVRWGMRTGLVEGVMAQLFLSVAYGTVITGLALLLGATSFHLGILGALPVMGALVQIPAAWWIERHGQRKRLAIVGSLGRLLWFVPAVLLFLPLPLQVKLALFLLALVAGQLMLGVASNAWLDWMTDLIPAGVRGRYFSTRQMLMNGVGLVVGLGGASLVDWSKQSGAEAWAYAFLLVLAAGGGSLATFLLSKQPEPPLERKPVASLRELLLMPLRHTQFRAFAGTFVIFQVGLGIAAPFFIAYGLQTLHLPLRTLALMDALTAVSALVAQSQWGKWADRIGQRQVLRICMLFVVPLPWMWILATPDWLWPLFFGNLLGGVMWGGLGMSQVNRLMEQAPCEGRPCYMAAFSVATGVPYMLASLGAGAFISTIGVDPVTLLGITFHPYLGFFLASGLLRLLAFLIGWKTV